MQAPVAHLRALFYNQRPTLTELLREKHAMVDAGFGPAAMPLIRAARPVGAPPRGVSATLLKGFAPPL